MRAIVVLTLFSGWAQAAGPLRVAVMDFTAASTASEFEPLGAGLQSMLTTDLGELPEIILVERSRLKDIQAELKLAESGAVDKATAAKIGGLAGASHLLVGSFTVVGGKMRIDTRLFAVDNGSVILSEKMEGAQTSFFELEKSLVEKIIKSVGVKLSKTQKQDLRKPQTTNFDAFQKYSEGLVLADQKKYPEAVAAMQSAVSADPQFALASAKLSEFQKLIPPPPKPEEPKQCKPNPTFAGNCQKSDAPEVPVQPMGFMGSDSRSYGIAVRTQNQEVRCATPCQLHLPAGNAELEVLSPVQFKKNLTLTGRPSSISVSGRNKTNLIIGATLSSAVVVMLVATIVLYVYEPTYSPTDPTSSNRNYAEYGPIPLSLATGMVFPAIYYLLKMGKNDASVISF